MDHTEKLEMNSNQAIVYLNQKALECLNDGGTPIILTPDDILTLKLLRDEFNSTRFTHREDPRRGLDHISVRQPTLETLERILKQVE